MKQTNFERAWEALEEFAGEEMMLEREEGIWTLYFSRPDKPHWTVLESDKFPQLVAKMFLKATKLTMEATCSNTQQE